MKTSANNSFLKEIKRTYNDKIYRHSLQIFNNCEETGQQEPEIKVLKYLQQFTTVKLLGRCKNCGTEIEAKYEFCDVECSHEYKGLDLPDPKVLGSDGMAMIYNSY